MATTTSLGKNDSLPIRMRADQREIIDLAAAVLSVRSRERVGAGPLLLERGLPHMHEIVNGASPAELRAARALLKDAA